jgi:hypothetical protein
MALKLPKYGSGRMFSDNMFPTDAELKSALTTDVSDLRRRASARKGEDMSKRVTEESYKGKNVSPEKKEAAERPKRRSAKKRGTSRYTPEPLPTGNIGSASGEMGPDMGRVNRSSDVDYFHGYFWIFVSGTHRVECCIRI